MLSRTDLVGAQIEASRNADSLLIVDTVIAMTGLSRATLYRRVKDGAFPSPRKIGVSVRWVAGEVTQWLATAGLGASAQEA